MAPAAKKKKQQPVKKVGVAIRITKPLTTAQAKRRMGGSFPDIKGNRFRYPKPTNEAAWTTLVNKAVAQREKDMAAVKSGREKPRCAMRAKYEYILFHCGPRTRQKRAIRNKHRKMHGLEKGDPRVVHHHDQKTMSFAKTVVMTPCQHKKIHGGACVKTKRK